MVACLSVEGSLVTSCCWRGWLLPPCGGVRRRSIPPGAYAPRCFASGCPTQGARHPTFAEAAFYSDALSFDHDSPCLVYPSRRRAAHVRGLDTVSRPHAQPSAYDARSTRRGRGQRFKSSSAHSSAHQSNILAATWARDTVRRTSGSCPSGGSLPASRSSSDRTGRCRPLPRHHAGVTHRSTASRRRVGSGGRPRPR
jgi:hypothetical protein